MFEWIHIMEIARLGHVCYSKYSKYFSTHSLSELTYPFHYLMYVRSNIIIIGTARPYKSIKLKWNTNLLFFTAEMRCCAPPALNHIIQWMNAETEKNGDAGADCRKFIRNENKNPITTSVCKLPQTERRDLAIQRSLNIPITVSLIQLMQCSKNSLFCNIPLHWNVPNRTFNCGFEY